MNSKKTVFGHEMARERSVSNENRCKRLRMTLRIFFEKNRFWEEKTKNAVFHGRFEKNQGYMVFRKSVLRAFLDDFDVFP